MVYFITKYALTAGIREVNEADVRSLKITEGRLLYFDRDGYPQSFGQSEWFTDKEAAIANAEARKEKKIASLKKQIAKLEKIKFE